MSPGITFRCTCEHCGAIFFGPDRKASACMKCAKRYKIRVEPPVKQSSEPDDDFLAAALTAPTPVPVRHVPTRPAAPPPPPPAPARHAPAPAPAPAQPKPRAARPPRLTEITDEKRAEILRAYENYNAREDVPLRRVHAEIAEKTNVARAVVARLVSEVRTPPAALTDAQKESIINHYREYVRGMARPEGGRRSTIAREMGLGRQQIVTTVREWAAAQPSITDLSRQDLFRIEVAFMNAVNARTPFDGLARHIAGELGYTDWQVERWMDMLHDGDFTDVDDPPADQKEAVIAAYHEYLLGEGPPPKSLHAVLAEHFGLAPRQVHKALVQYRLGRRQEAFGF